MLNVCARASRELSSYVKRNNQTGTDVFESNLPSCCKPMISLYSIGDPTHTTHSAQQSTTQAKVCKSGQMHLGWKKMVL